jgi:hypothetical protein
MKKPILIYGAIAGAIPITACVFAFSRQGEQDMSSPPSALMGYLVMLISFCVIFLAVKRHRDLELGGVIRFLPAFLLGLGISAIAGLVYVVGWEAYLATTDFNYVTQYADAMIEAKKAAGMAGEELAAYVAEMEQMNEMYAKPWFRIPLTFTEIFPVGLLVSLIAALVLRKSEVLPAHDPPVEASA